MPSDRRIKYIIDSALRRIQESTAYSPPDDSAPGDAFNIYVDMIYEFVNDGYLPCEYPIPVGINDPVGQAIPQGDMINMLVVRMAAFWDVQVSFGQSSLASKAYERLASTMQAPKIKRNPIPANYRFYDRWPVQCSHDDDCCGSDCNG